MIQLLGSFCGQPASAMKPGTFAVDGTPYTPDRSASRSRMPVAASVLGSGFGACALLVAVPSRTSIAAQMASRLRFIVTPYFGSVPFPSKTKVNSFGGTVGPAGAFPGTPPGAGGGALGSG